MKRSEIKVGDVFYMDPSPDWAAPKWISRVPGCRATITAMPPGRYLIADVESAGGAYRPGASVQAQALRGPYDECVALVAKAIEERLTAGRSAREASDADQARAEALIDRAGTLGLAGARIVYDYASNRPTIRRIAYDLDAFETLLDQHEQDNR